MNPEIAVLAASAAGIAFFHTLLGPDHYLPFVAMAKASGWNMGRTLRVTLICGLGHLAGSVLLGLAGIFMGTRLSSLEWLESVRGNLAAWLLIAFGLVYMAWGIRQACRNRPHRHWHSHGEVRHSHAHSHHDDHAHIHSGGAGSRALTPWVIFVIFVLGPCEPLIPLLMYPAARESIAGVLIVVSVFGLVTVFSMVLAVTVTGLGLRAVRLKRFERYANAAAGAVILACGVAVMLSGGALLP